MNARVTSLKGRMLLWILPVVVGGIAILAVLAISRATSNERTVAFSDLQHRTQTAAAWWNGDVDTAFQFTRALAAAGPTLVAMSPQAEYGQLGRFERSAPAGTSYVTVETVQPSPDALVPGIAFLPGKGLEPYPLPYKQAAPEVEAMIAHPGPKLSQPEITQGTAYTTFSEPVTVGGRTIGLAEIAGDLGSEFSAVANEKLYRTGYVIGVSGTGKIVVAPDRKLDGVASLASLAATRHIPQLNQIAADVARGVSGQAQMTDPITGQHSVLTWAPVRDAGWAVVTSVPVGQVLAPVNSLRTTLIIVSLIVLLLVGIVIFLVAGRLTKPIGVLTEAADRVSEGDVDVELDVHERDEIGLLAGSFARTVEYLRDKAAAADRVAAGDLTVDVEPRSERDLLGHAFAKLVADLRGIVGRVASSAEGVAGASQQIASTSQEAGRANSEVARAVTSVATGAERQVRIVGSAQEAAQQVAHAIAESARNAKETAEVAERASDTAREGVAAAEQANDAMHSVRDSSEAVTDAIRDLADKSEKIGAIVVTITGIAEQTNLLALNAAIEAARAGEQGRGFAVVAEEVRKLAEDSQHAAEEIAALIKSMQTETEKAVGVVERGAAQTSDGAATVERTREAFVRIGAAVDDIAGRIEQMANGAEQIAAGALAMQEHMGEVASVAEESSASTEQVSASTQETTASAQEIAQSAEALASTAGELQRLVGEFRLDRE